MYFLYIWSRPLDGLITTLNVDMQINAKFLPPIWIAFLNSKLILATQITTGEILLHSTGPNKSKMCMVGETLFLVPLHIYQMPPT